MRNIFKQPRLTRPLSELSPAAKKFEAVRGSLDAAYAAHLALTDVQNGSAQTTQDEVLHSNPNIVDLRHIHLEYQAEEPAAIANIDPHKYLKGFKVLSHVTLIPAETEQPPAIQEIV